MSLTEKIFCWMLRKFAEKKITTQHTEHFSFLVAFLSGVSRLCDFDSSIDLFFNYLTNFVNVILNEDDEVWAYMLIWLNCTLLIPHNYNSRLEKCN